MVYVIDDIASICNQFVGIPPIKLLVNIRIRVALFSIPKYNPKYFYFFCFCLTKHILLDINYIVSNILLDFMDFKEVCMQKNNSEGGSKMRSISTKLFALPVLVFFMLAMASFSIATSYASDVRSGIGSGAFGINAINADEAAKALLSGNAAVVDLRSPYMHELFNVSASDDESDNLELGAFVERLLSGQYEGMPVVGIVDEASGGFVRDVLSYLEDMLGGSNISLLELTPKNAASFEGQLNTFENIPVSDVEKYYGYVKFVSQVDTVAAAQAQLAAVNQAIANGTLTQEALNALGTSLDSVAANNPSCSYSVLSAVAAVNSFAGPLTGIANALASCAPATPPVVEVVPPVVEEVPPVVEEVPPVVEEVPPVVEEVPPVVEEVPPVAPVVDLSAIQAQLDNITALLTGQQAGVQGQLDNITAQLDNITALLDEILAGQVVEEPVVEEGGEEVEAPVKEEPGFFTRLVRRANLARSARYERRLAQVRTPRFDIIPFLWNYGRTIIPGLGIVLGFLPDIDNKFDRLTRRYDRRIDRSERWAAVLDGDMKFRDMSRDRELDRIGRDMATGNGITLYSVGKLGLPLLPSANLLYDLVVGTPLGIVPFVGALATQFLKNTGFINQNSINRLDSANQMALFKLGDGASLHDAIVEGLATFADGGFAATNGINFDIGDNKLGPLPHVFRVDERRYRRDIRKAQRRERLSETLFGQNQASSGEVIRQIGYSDDPLKTLRGMLSSIGENTLTDLGKTRKADRKLRREMVDKEFMKDRRTRGLSRVGIFDKMQTDRKIRRENRQILRKARRAERAGESKAEKRENRRSGGGLLSSIPVIGNLLGGNNANDSETVEPQVVESEVIAE